MREARKAFRRPEKVRAPVYAFSRSIQRLVNCKDIGLRKGCVIIGEQPLLRAHHIFGKCGQVRLCYAVFPQGLAFEDFVQ